MRRPAAALLALLLAALLVAAPVAAAAPPVEVQVERDGGVMGVLALARASAPVETCYSTLTDFDRLADFIPGMQKSRVTSPAGEPLRVEQVGRTGAGPFSFVLTVTLGLTLEPPTRIDFVRVAGNLKRMDGRWLVEPAEGGCSIGYRATIEPQFWVPPLIGPLLMRQQVTDQLQGLVGEIERRSGRASPP